MKNAANGWKWDISESVKGGNASKGYKEARRLGYVTGQWETEVFFSKVEMFKIVINYCPG